MPEFLSTHFWLFCGIWVGGIGSISFHIRLRKVVEIPEVDRMAITRFSIGWFAAIMIPCVLLWLIQLSSGPAPKPDYFTWPTPQRGLALGITVACWVLLLWWVWLSNGAEQLSKFLTFAWPNQPRFIYSPLAIKVLSVLVIVAGAYGVAQGTGWGPNG